MWVRKSEPKNSVTEHLCRPPYRRGPLGEWTRHAAGNNGDVWECDSCQKQWIIKKGCWKRKFFRLPMPV